MTDKQNIIIVKELQNRLAFHEKNGYTTAFDLSAMRDDVMCFFPSIASSFDHAMEECRKMEKNLRIAVKAIQQFKKEVRFANGNKETIDPLCVSLPPH